MTAYSLSWKHQPSLPIHFQVTGNIGRWLQLKSSSCSSCPPSSDICQMVSFCGWSLLESNPVSVDLKEWPESGGGSGCPFNSDLSPAIPLARCVPVLRILRSLIMTSLILTQYNLSLFEPYPWRTYSASTTCQSIMIFFKEKKL